MDKELLELSTIDELFSLDDEGECFFEEMREEFKVCIAAGIQTLKENEKALDFEKISDTAHAMKSMAGNLGAKKIFQNCRYIENNISIQNIDELQGYIFMLEVDLAQTEKAFDYVIEHYKRI